MNIIINKTESGQVFKCSKCNAIHIEYKNLNFNFSEKQYKHFADSILDLDGNKWERKNRNAHYRRKIIIPIGHKNVNILLNNAELQELKQLFSDKEPNGNVSEDIKIMNLNFTNFLN